MNYIDDLDDLDELYERNFEDEYKLNQVNRLKGELGDNLDDEDYTDLDFYKDDYKELNFNNNG